MAWVMAVLAMAEPDGLAVLSQAQAALPAHHTRHLERFGRGASREARAVLAAVDWVQSTAPRGGGYFANPKAVPLESPIGAPLRLWGRTLFEPGRTTSFCSGATYAVLVDALNRLKPSGSDLPDEAWESFRQTEADGRRRENQVGFWGAWNGEGAGLENALTVASQMGDRVAPRQARPGDFMHIFWRNGLGHSVVFLGWQRRGARTTGVRFWSSQKATHGLGDWTVPSSRIGSVVVVRLARPLAALEVRPGVFPYAKAPGDPLP